MSERHALMRDKVAVLEPEIEIVCRAMCSEDGFDPDKEGEETGSGKALWESYRVPAILFLSALNEPSNKDGETE